jgi:phage terminase Nu1 subunit (DNA packaging protein)
VKKGTSVTRKQRAARQENAAKASEGRRRAVAARRREAKEELEELLGEAGIPDIRVSMARREAARAELAEIEVAEKRGDLVSAEEAEAELDELCTVVKTRILGVPTRFRQRVPHLAVADLDLLDLLLREALEELGRGDGDSDQIEDDEA